MGLFAPIPLKQGRQCSASTMVYCIVTLTSHERKSLLRVRALHNHAPMPRMSFFSCTSRRLLHRASDGNSSSMRG